MRDREWDGARSSGIRRVHFDIDGVPMLDLTEDRDLVEKYKKIETVLVVDKNGIGKRGGLYGTD